MVAITVIFYIVVGAVLTPLIFAVNDLIIYKIKNSKISSRKNNIISVIDGLILLLIAVPYIVFLFWLATTICATKLGCYFAVVVYTLLLSILSSSKTYLSPDVKVDTAYKVFKKAFTVSSIRHIFSILYLRVIIEIAYLVFLVLAQIEELGFCTLPAELSFFCTLNKYGIIILFAVEKIIKSVEPERERRKILSNTFVEQENKEEKERQEIRRSWKEFREEMKKQRQERKLNKKRRKENNKK